MGAAQHVEPPLPFTFSEIVVRRQPPLTRALVMTPSNRTVVGRERLGRIVESSSLSDVERRMLQRIEDRTPGTPILVFNAAVGDQSLWRFDPSFSEDELLTVGSQFVSSLLPFYRRVVAAGIVSFAHVGWQPNDLVPLRRGLASLAKSLETHNMDPDLRALDEWIVKNLLLYSSLVLPHFVSVLLPQHLTLLARRSERCQNLVSRVRPELLG